MVEGKESVLYALPFCAGTVTGIFLCGHEIFYSAAPYGVAACSLAACMFAVTAAILFRNRMPGVMRDVLVLSAVFLCGLFCWSNRSVTDISEPSRYGADRKNAIEKATEPAAVWLKAGIDFGTLNADTAVTIKNCTFTNCKGIYEGDTPVENFIYVAENNTEA